MAPTPEKQNDRLQAAFQLEEYKQVLSERRFVMTRYMQAIGLYLALSGFALKELDGAPSIALAWILASAFTVLNVVAVFAPRQFRNMARHALERERDYSTRYQLRLMYELFWGYHAGLVLVGVDEAAVISIIVSRLLR